MDTPVTPDPDAAGTTQRRSFIPAEDDPAFLPFFLAALGQPITGQVHTWEYRPPIRDIAPPRVQICNRDGDVLHDLPVTNLQINWTNAQPVYTYESGGALPPGIEQVAMDSAWDVATATGQSFDSAFQVVLRALDAPPAFTYVTHRDAVLMEPTSEQRAAAEQWQRDRAARLAQERADRAAASDRAEALLLSLLTPRQRREYGETHTIPVRGSDKRRYRLEYGTVGNVKELNRAGLEIASWCAAPTGDLPTEDVLAAQLLWLRADAPGFRAVANRTRTPSFLRESRRGGYVRVGDLHRALYAGEGRVSGHWIISP